MLIRVQEAAFDPGAVLAEVGRENTGVGAVAAFTGLVRADGGLLAMEIEHYPEMTERAIRGFAAEAAARFSLQDVAVVHRFGRLGPGETIMMVACAAAHRGDAFRAAEFLMDWLKSRAPFWKKEIGPGGEAWVAARGEDEAALARW